jgi:hypothetical protein
MKIDDATADRLLRTGVVSFDQAVSKMLKVSVTQNQYDALVSLAYNIGTRALSTSTLMKKLNAGDVKGAADEFLRWNRSGGKVMAGLTIAARQSEKSFYREHGEPMNYLINRLKEPSTWRASSWSLLAYLAADAAGHSGNRHRWRRSAGWRCWRGDAGQR